MSEQEVFSALPEWLQELWRLDSRIARKAEKEIAVLKAQHDELLAVLNRLRRDHATCEDSWYSCPKSGECLNKDDGDRCTCGADEHNAIIDAAIASAEKTPC